MTVMSGAGLQVIFKALEVDDSNGEVASGNVGPPGTPTTAGSKAVDQPPPADPNTVNQRSGSLWPTRKWWAQVVVSVTALLTLLITNGWDFNKEAQITVVAAVAQWILTYLVPNYSTPGGVPVTKI